MNPTAERVLSAALALTDGDRADLIDALIASLEPEDHAPFDESLRPIIERRSAELQAGQVEAIPWERVRRRARDAAGG
jgi:putative addiction module component (TIGR02574 family)